MRNKNNKKFEEVVLGLLDELFQFALRLTNNNRALAEDLVQETLLRAYRAFDRFEEREYGVKPWLLKIMHNIYFNELVAQKRRRESTNESQLNNIEDQHPEYKEEFDINNVDWEQFDEEIKNQISQLPDEYRVVLLLWALGEFNYKEIADICDIPIGTVMSRLFRARKQLAKNLTSYAEAHRLINNANRKITESSQDVSPEQRNRN